MHFYIIYHQIWRTMTLSAIYLLKQCLRNVFSLKFIFGSKTLFAILRRPGPSHKAVSAENANFFTKQKKTWSTCRNNVIFIEYWQVTCFLLGNISTVLSKFLCLQAFWNWALIYASFLKTKTVSFKAKRDLIHGCTHKFTISLLIVN